MDITTATPAEIDTEIHRLDVERMRHGMYLTSLRRDLGELENQNAGYGASRRIHRTIPELRADIARTGRRIVDLNMALSGLTSEFARRGGWTRWYLVPNRHLHYDVSSDRCSRIPTTAHYWMTEHSGRSADEMIELAGDRVCTTCFPNAPVAPRPAAARFMTPSEAECAAYREAAARKRAAKVAAQITTPDGNELRAANDVFGDLIKTEIAARRRLLSDASDLALYGPNCPDAAEWRETIQRMVEAIAHRDDVKRVELLDETVKKVNKKARKEKWTPHQGWTTPLYERITD